MILRDLLKDPALSSRPPLHSHGWKEGSKIKEMDFGGWIEIKEAESPKVMDKKTGKMRESEFINVMPNVSGFTPVLPKGFDLLGTNRKRPSPYLPKPDIKPVTPNDEVMKFYMDYGGPLTMDPDLTTFPKRRK